MTIPFQSRRPAAVVLTCLLAMPLLPPSPAIARPPDAPRTGSETAETPSPYAGLESRPIKALSPEQIEGYLEGAGMGFAMAAELNSHPGPKHVLELAPDLELTEEQRLATQAAFDRMQTEARALGAEIVEQERQLDRRFAASGLQEEELRSALASIAELQGRLRHAHLAAHLRMVEILTPEQVTRYDELRGYATGDAEPMVHDPSRHHH